MKHAAVNAEAPTAGAGTKVNYWHPVKGGWHLGEELSRTAKLVTIQPAGNGRRLHVPVEDVRAAEAERLRPEGGLSPVPGASKESVA